MVRGGGDGPGGGYLKNKIEDIHLYRFSCILVDIFAYYGSFAPKRHVDSYSHQGIYLNIVLLISSLQARVSESLLCLIAGLPHVREKSGIFLICQGKTEFWKMSRKSDLCQGENKYPGVHAKNLPILGHQVPIFFNKLLSPTLVG